MKTLVKEIRIIVAQKNKNIKNVVYSVHRPKNRQEKLDDFVMSNSILTIDDLYKLSYSGGMIDVSLIACCRRTGKKFIKIDRESWKIK